jgi:hypothetical protein
VLAWEELVSKPLALHTQMARVQYKGSSCPQRVGKRLVVPSFQRFEMVRMDSDRLFDLLEGEPSFLASLLQATAYDPLLVFLCMHFAVDKQVPNLV